MTKVRSTHVSATLALGAALLLTLGLTACSSDDPDPAAGSASSDTAKSATPTTTAPTATTPTGSSSAPARPSRSTLAPMEFGDSVTWDEGLGITVSAPEPYRLSEYAVPGPAADNVTLEVTITNRTDKVFDATYFTTRMRSDGSAATEIFDSANGLTGAPESRIPAGGKVEFRIGYNVSDPDDLELEVHPDADLPAALFVS